MTSDNWQENPFSEFPCSGSEAISRTSAATIGVEEEDFFDKSKGWMEREEREAKNLGHQNNFFFLEFGFAVPLQTLKLIIGQWQRRKQAQPTTSPPHASVKHPAA